MKKKSFLILPVFINLFLFPLNSFSQTYEDDTLAVRAILDSNGLHDVSVEDVIIDSADGRIIELDLESQDLTSLPAEIGNLTGLLYLYLSENNLTSIPPEIENLTNLIEIYLDYNKLTSIPPEIGNLGSLQWLLLNDNDLTSLPAEIGNLGSLGLLDLSNNKLTSLPDSIIKLTPNEELDLSFNNLDINNLSDKIIVWLDEYDPDWRETQNVPIIFDPNSNINSHEFYLNILKSSIHFNLTASGNAKLQIYNMKGRLLETLVDSYKQSGTYSVHWDSHKYGSGVYYLKLSIGNNTLIQKAVILK